MSIQRVDLTRGADPLAPRNMDLAVEPIEPGSWEDPQVQTIFRPLFDYIRQTSLQREERLRQIWREYMETPAVITRDFSSFPYPLLPLTDDDKRDAYAVKCLKFQTPYYIAYIHEDYQDYVTPELLYSADESEAMKEARRCVFGKLPGAESYAIRRRYSDEVTHADYELGLIESRHFREHREEYGEDIAEKLDKLEEKYTVENFLYKKIGPLRSVVKVVQEHPGKCFIGAAAALVAAVFFSQLEIVVAVVLGMSLIYFDNTFRGEIEWIR